MCPFSKDDIRRKKILSSASKSFIFSLVFLEMAAGQQGIDVFKIALQQSMTTSSDSDVVAESMDTALKMMEEDMHADSPDWTLMINFLRFKIVRDNVLKEQKHKQNDKKGSGPSQSGDDDGRSETEGTDICPAAPSSVVFDDVKGGKQMEEAKLVIKQYTILPLQFPGLFSGVGGAVLFYGVPGTGKTTLAEAASNASMHLGKRESTVCGSINALPLFSVGVTDIKSQYVGEAEKKLSNALDAAKKMAPSIIFFDEADGIFDPSDKNSAGVINTFKQEMGGFGAKQSGIVVIFATNHPLKIDGAIKSRLGVSIEIPLPNMEARLEICKRTLKQLSGFDKGVPQVIARHCAPSMHISNVKLGTNMTYSGRDLDTICRQIHSLVLREQVALPFVEPIPTAETDGVEMGRQMYRFTSQPDSKNAIPVASLDEAQRRSIVGRNITAQDAWSVLQQYTPTVKQSDIEEQIAYNKEMGKVHATLQDAVSHVSQMYEVSQASLQAVLQNFSDQLNQLQFPCGINTTVPES